MASRIIRRLVVAVAVTAMMLVAGAASCEDDCPTPKNKGVCINKYWEDK